MNESIDLGDLSVKKSVLNLKNFISVFCIFVFALTGAATTLYGDDFIYALYLRHGFLNFIKMTGEHYMQMNGRAAVHFLLELILVFKDRLFFVVIPLLIMSVYFFAGCALDVKQRTLFFALALSGTLILPYTILREGVFWMAGTMNYIYPTALALAAFYVFRRSAEEERIKVSAVFVLFLSGASTEQGGAAAIAAAALYSIIRFRDKKDIKRCIIMLLIMAVGYATVVLSPSTFGRTVAETSEALSLIERLRLVYDFSVGRNSAFLVFESVLLLLAADELKLHKPVSAMLAAAAAASGIFKLLGMYTAAGIILTAALTAEGIFGLFFGKTERSALLLAGLASVGMLVFSVTFGYRNILPCLLILIAVGADVLCDIAPGGKKSAYALAVVFVFGVVSFAPTFCGYAENRKIINENLTAIGDGTSDFYYNADLNPKYSYNQFISDDYYQAAYRDIYRIRDGVKIYIKGAGFRDLYHNGIHCENPIYIKDGKNYYPLRNIIEAEGGQLVYNEKTKLTDISVKGKSVIFDNEKNVFTADGFEIDGAGYRLDDRKYGYMTKANLYFSAELYKKVFGIDVEG